MRAVMMVAMMLPSAAPVTLLIASIAKKRREAGTAPGLTTAPFMLGYLAVWFGFAAAATLLQWQLDMAEQLAETRALPSTMVAGGVLGPARIHERPRLKHARPRQRRSPLPLPMPHVRGAA